MKYLLSAFVFISAYHAFASESGLRSAEVLESPSALIQMPENCLAGKKFPCLVRADSNYENYDIGFKNKVSFFKKSVIKFEAIGSKQTQVELIKGSVLIKYGTESDLQVNGVAVGGPDLYFIQRNENDVKVYRSHQSEFLNFSIHSGGREPSTQVSVSEFPTRDKVTEFVGQFIKPEHSLYKIVINDHTVRLKDESHQQQVFLQRKIAAEEQAKKDDAEARQKRNVENKKLKDLFFMRTFQ
jgi:hypothetical protein